MTGSTQHSYAFMGFDSRLRLRHRSGSRHLKNSGTNPSGSELSVVEPILTCWGQAKCVILCDFPIKLKHSSKGEHNPLWKSPLSYHDCMILHMQLYIYICIYIYIYTYWAEPSTFLYIHIYIYIYTYMHTYVEDFPSGVYYCSFSGMYFWAHHCFDVLSGGFLGIMVTLCVLLGAWQLDSTQPVAGVGIGICWEVLT